jgi:serine phosphatase RsbU (regulator of sigma subunit)
MNSKLHVLLVEDSDEDADLLMRFLKKNHQGFTCTRVWEEDSFTAALKNGSHDLIIADHTMPRFSGMQAFRLTRAHSRHIPFILVTGTVSEKLLTEYAKEGIDDYLLKDNLLRLPAAIENVVNKKKLEVANRDLQSALKDITDSINYAKIIQNAILPNESVFRRQFPGSFVLFKPKDIVSGDFYWLDKSGGNYMVAVADCTGHGVPGSLLAMMGINLLNECINIKKLVKPSGILARLNKQVRGIFRNGQESISDGMDIAVCAIDPVNYILTYAGANRPLLIVRNKQLIEVKPDKLSIGGREKKDMSFTDHEVKIFPGDKIFMFSDGYADQFHYKTGKKIMVKRLKNLLTLTSDLPTAAQKTVIARYFRDWKNKQEQVDDVLILCVKIS